MIWDARKLSDEAYYKRRVIIGSIVTPLMALSALRGVYSISTGDLLGGILGLIVWGASAIYIGRIVLNDYRELKKNG